MKLSKFGLSSTSKMEVANDSFIDSMSVIFLFCLFYFFFHVLHMVLVYCIEITCSKLVKSNNFTFNQTAEMEIIFVINC